MNALRLEADEAQSQVEELKAKIKALEQENLAKEQEITSLTHRNQLLEGEIEKVEGNMKEYKDKADVSAQHDTQNEALQRRLQLLEEEAEEADKNLRETNEKYVLGFISKPKRVFAANYVNIDSARPMSRPATTSERFKLSRSPTVSGKPSTRRWPRNMPICRRSCTSWRFQSAMFK